VGEADLGKTLIFVALAQMWGAREPVSMADALAQFNGPIASCPIWFDDECKALKEHDVSSSTFRAMIQQRQCKYQLKGLEKRELIGCSRLGLTANDLTDIRFGDVAGPGAVSAIADRFSLHIVPPERSTDVRAALQALRLPGTNDIDLDRIKTHIAWIWANHAPRVQRFIGRREDSRLAQRAALMGVLARFPEVFEKLASGHVADWSSDLGVEQAPLIRHDGRLYVRPVAFVGDHGRTPSLADVHTALKPFRAGEPKAIHRRQPAELKVKVWELDRALLDAAGIDR
jgi:hypothetical protein